MKKNQLKFAKLKSLLLMAVMLLSVSWAQAADIYIKNDINWSAITGGSGTGGIPNATDNVYTRGNVVTVNIANAVCNTLNLGKTGNLGTLTFNNGSQLTVTSFNNIGNKINVLNMSAGGTFICSGISLATNGSLTWTPGTGTVVFPVNITLPSTVFTSFNNLTISGGTTTLGTSISVGGTLLQSGGNIATGTNTLTVNGTHNVGLFTVSGAGTYTLSSGATLNTPNLAGITSSGATGSIQTTTRNFNTAASYIFSGGADQVTGNGLPATVSSFTVQNTGGVVTLSNPSLTATTATINAGAKLTVNSGQSLSATVLNILSDATNGTGTFVNGGTSSFTTANVNQYLYTVRRSWYMTSPVNGTVNLNYAPTDIQWYDETLGDPAGWTASSSWTTGMGYMVTPNATNYTNLAFTGTLNNGTYTMTLTRTSGKTREGYNLLGNPYPSYFNLFKVFDTDNDDDIDVNDTDNNIMPTYWIRTKTSGNWGFDTYNMASGFSTSNSGLALTKNIPPMQAFWLRVNTTAGATLNFANDKREHRDNANNKFRAPGAVKAVNQIIRLQVTNGVSSDEAIVYFNANAADGYDMYDSPKMMNGTTSVNPDIYTRVGTENIVINGMNTIPYDDKGIDLYFVANAASGTSFTINAKEFSNFEAGTQVWIKNKQTGLSQLISDGASFTFDVTETGTNPKFSLIIKAPGSTTKLVNTEKSNIFVFANENGQITVNCNDTFSSDASVTIYNSVGQRIAAKTLSGNKTLVENSLNTGVYVVTVNNAGRKSIEKIIIK